MGRGTTQQKAKYGAEHISRRTHSTRGWHTCLLGSQAMYLPGMASPPGPKLTGLLTLPWYAEGTLKFSGGSQGSPDFTSSWSNASTRGRGTWPGTLLGLRPWASNIKRVPHNDRASLPQTASASTPDVGPSRHPELRGTLSASKSEIQLEGNGQWFAHKPGGIKDKGRVWEACDGQDVSQCHSSHNSG